jgi:hypothetical protein
MVKKEIRIFEGEGIKRVNLQLVYNCLSTMAPSTIESERAFCSANQVCTKIRFSLNDNNVVCLCFSSGRTLFGQILWIIKLFKLKVTKICNIF